MPLPELQPNGSNWLAWKVELEFLAKTMGWKDHLTNKVAAPSPVRYIDVDKDTPAHIVLQNQKIVEQSQRELRTYNYAVRSLLLSIFASLPIEL